MKKAGLILLIALLALAMSGCTIPSGSKASPTSGPGPSDTTPGVITTQQAPVTATPATSVWLSGYKETNVNREQYLPGGMKVSFDKYYTATDYQMPVQLGGPNVRAASHGVVLKVKFYNPSSSTRPIVLDSDVKVSFSYFDESGVRHILTTADVFYDNETGKMYMDTNLSPGETKTMWVLAYISSDEDYRKYGSRLDPMPTLDVNPGYVPI